MHVTVAICTWNRAELLDATLDQFRHLHIPPAVTWELLVVDNQCTDNTHAIVRKHSGILPIKSLSEPKQGLSHARNCAVAHASGDILLWTDDDVLVDKQWLSAYVLAARRWPGADYFGGPVLPWLESPLPKWMRPIWNELSPILAIREFYEDTFPIPRDRIPVGANMACRVGIAKKYLFSTTLGRTKDSQIGGEESAWFDKAYTDGHRGAWVGDAVLRHYLPGSRLTKHYLARWFSGAGVVLAREQESVSMRRFFGYPIWALRQLATASIKSIMLASVGGTKWYTAFSDAAKLRGYLRESRRLHRCA